MDKNLLAHIEYLLCVRFLTITTVSGGDISQAFLLETETEKFFCKLNRNAEAYSMFLAEKAGLEAISKTKTIATPKVLLCENLDDGALLLMEYIPSKRASASDMALFGHQLAALHSETDLDFFGWKANNFIGSLEQSNEKQSDWPEFYVQERLFPQLKLAEGKGLLGLSEIPSEERLLTSCRNLFPKVRPSLLHGDLWSGNYLIAQNGTPYLIDPAVYYGHYEVDMAMTQLFGGFGSVFYRSYSEHFPGQQGEQERRDIYQLFYLLVHLNLFGRSYYGSVKNIMDTYF